jgi:hypothetical protein
MGCEYSLDFEVVDRDLADRVLRSIPGFEGYDSTYQLYAFRRTAVGGMPDVWAKLEERAVWICWNAGAQAIVTEIQAALAAAGLDAELREL